MTEQVRRPTGGIGPTELSARAPQLTLRVGSQDEVMVRSLCGLTPGVRRASWLPDRFVVDAHVPVSSPKMAGVARAAGRPFLIDPETYYLQDTQHESSPWLKVPFAIAREVSLTEWTGDHFQDALVKSVIDYQLGHDATMVIPPYVHIDTPTSPLISVQADLLRRAREYLSANDIQVPVLAVIAMGWRCLHPSQGVPALGEVWAALAALAPAEVAVAASKVHAGKSVQDRITEFLMLIRDLSATYKVTAWQQGLLGEAAIVEGASGYETGIGRREFCDLQSRKAQQRRPQKGQISPRAVFLDSVGRSVSKRRLELASRRSGLWRQLICTDPACCAPGGADLLGDARRHTVITRVKRLAALHAMGHTRWQWTDIATRATQGIALGNQINRLDPQTGSIPEIDLEPLVAIRCIAAARVHRRGRVRRTA